MNANPIIPEAVKIRMLPSARQLADYGIEIREATTFDPKIDESGRTWSVLRFVIEIDKATMTIAVTPNNSTLAEDCDQWTTLAAAMQIVNRMRQGKSFPGGWRTNDAGDRFGYSENATGDVIECDRHGCVDRGRQLLIGWLGHVCYAEPTPEMARVDVTISSNGDGWLIDAATNDYVDTATARKLLAGLRSAIHLAEHLNDGAGEGA